MLFFLFCVKKCAVSSLKTQGRGTMKKGNIKFFNFHFLIFCLLFSGFQANANSLKNFFCRGLFSSQAVNSSASSVFIDFAKESLGENISSEINSQWETQIPSFVKDWTDQEAKDFLNDLKLRIGEKATIKLMQRDFVYFEGSGYKKFRATVSFYEGLLREEVVTQQLKHSLRGFFYPDSLRNLKQVVRFFVSYLKKNRSHSEEGMDAASIKKQIIKNIDFLSHIPIRELKQSVRYLETYIKKQEIQKKMKEDFRYFYWLFSQKKLQQLEKQLDLSNKPPVPHFFSSWDEAELFLLISKAGYWVVPKYEISKNKMNLVIIGYKKKLVVEYKGKSDFLEETEAIKRKDMLEKLGWEFWEISSTDFNKNKSSSLKDLWELLEDMRIYPLNQWLIDEIQVKNQNRNLFEKLKELRMEIAREQTGVPYFSIFSTDTLLKMSMRKIKRKEQFLEIEGVTSEKLELYGEQFLKVMKEHYDFELHEKLRGLRWTISVKREQDSSVATIFSNTVLIEMSRNPTRDQEKLLGIKEVTRKKLELYGDPFVEVMKAHLDQELLEELKRVRREISNERNIPASSIFSNKILKEMVDQLIQDKEQLSNLRGVGPKKLEQYGDQFLQIIKEHLNYYNQELQNSENSNSFIQ